MQSVSYENFSDNPNTNTRTISFSINDGKSDSNIVTSEVNVTAVNDAPVTTSGATVEYYQDDAPVIVDSEITLSDLDDLELEGATIYISANYQNGEDILSFTDQNGITGSWDAATGTMTLSGTATIADYQTALQSITYENSGDSMTSGSRTISFTVNDGDSDSTVANSTVDVFITPSPLTTDRDKQDASKQDSLDSRNFGMTPLVENDYLEDQDGVQLPADQEIMETIAPPPRQGVGFDYSNDDNNQQALGNTAFVQENMTNKQSVVNDMAIDSDFRIAAQGDDEGDMLPENSANFQLETPSEFWSENELASSLNLETGRGAEILAGVVSHEDVNKSSQTAAEDKNEKHDPGTPGYGGSESIKPDAGRPGLTAQLGAYGKRGFQTEVDEFLDTLKPPSK
ncbi:MAG: hypothetical protein HQL69_20565 [Magnetococcales bacterium]|nr:hypothetical protein [Magnetococcales bacterium]